MDIQRNPRCLLWGDGAQKLPKMTDPAAAIWMPPCENMLKWNVDASYNTAMNKAAIGGVLRNHLGHFKCVFSMSIPTMEINSAEVLAIHRALSITLANDVFRKSSLMIESDSANDVAWCTGEKGGPWNLGFHLNFIRSACNGELDITIVHKGRSSNQVVDTLAKQGHARMDHFVAWL